MWRCAMEMRVFRFGLWSFAAVGLVGSTGRAMASPSGAQLWSGKPAGGAVRVYADGERAIGGLRGKTDAGELELTLLGLYQQHDGEYKGRIAGTVRSGGRSR